MFVEITTVFRKLQHQLTLSHLLVTIVSVFILAILVLAGIIAYFKTPFAAKWACDVALGFAQELALKSEQAKEPLQNVAVSFMSNNTVDLVPAEFETETGSSSVGVLGLHRKVLDPYRNDWLIVLSPEGSVLASNYSHAFPIGMVLSEQNLPGFKTSWLGSKNSRFNFLWPEKWAHFANYQGKYAVGLAPIIDGNNDLQGWFYYRAFNPIPLDKAFTAIGSGIVAASIVAMLISGLVGRQLARSFSRRIRQISRVSAAFAAGHMNERVNLSGEDEIARLGQQFNFMAEQISAQMKTLKHLAQKNVELNEEAATLVKMEERNRLARELHDGVKQQLFSLYLVAGSAIPLIKDQPDQAKERLEKITETSHKIAVEMDHIIKQLRPLSLDDKGLVMALSELTEEWIGQTGITVNLRIQGERILPRAMEQTLYRIVQEALNNILKHAKASQVNLVLRFEFTQVKLLIQDDGCGFDLQVVDTQHSLGIQSMQERIHEIGGRFKLRTNHKQGTTIFVTVPHAALEAKSA